VAAIELPFEKVEGLHDAGIGVVAIPASWSSGHTTPVLIMPRSPAIPLGLAPATSGMDDTVVAPFGDGSFLITWQGTAYRWHDGKLTALQPLSVRSCADAAVAMSDGSLVVACTDALVRIAPDDRRERNERFAGARRVVRGPGDAVIVTDADPDSCLKIWWSATNQVTAVASEVFALDWEPEVVYYDAPRELLVVVTQDVQAMPWHVFAALPRT